jgi:UDP-N-acetylmuramoyl-tripeptide--D-alanyl-D-alanine ligase
MPNIALITNIGEAHIGIIGSREEIAKEKKQIFSRFPNTTNCFGKNTAFIPADSEYANLLAEGVAGRTVFYSNESADITKLTDCGICGSEFLFAGRKVKFNLTGGHNVRNAVSAIHIAREAGVGDAAIAEALTEVKPVKGRGEVFS